MFTMSFTLMFGVHLLLYFQVLPVVDWLIETSCNENLLLRDLEHQINHYCASHLAESYSIVDRFYCARYIFCYIYTPIVTGHSNKHIFNCSLLLMTQSAAIRLLDFVLYQSIGATRDIEKVLYFSISVVLQIPLKVVCNWICWASFSDHYAPVDTWMPWQTIQLWPSSAHN